jgi:RNA polymerase sigma-70 factor (ECF subfamily)
MTTPNRQDRFVSLLAEHRKILYKVAGSYCREPADREDLVQEMAVQLWRSFDRYDERYRFSTWMYRVALNVAISFHRSASRRSRDLVQVDGAILDLVATAADAGAGGDADEDLRTLYGYIERLDELDRALVILYLDGNRYDTIAEILGISETNVGTKLGRIKQRMRRDLGPAA